MQPGRVGVAGAVAVAAAGVPFGDRARQRLAGPGDGRELGGDPPGLRLVAGGDTHCIRVAYVRDPGHVLLYIYSMSAMDAADAGYPARWRPSPGTPPQAAAFARQVVAACGPLSRDRAKNLLWAAGKLASYGIGLGLEPVPEVLLHPR